MAMTNPHPISSNLRTLLGSYRTEVEEQDDLPEILGSFGEQEKLKITVEVECVFDNLPITSAEFERLTGYELPDDHHVRQFFGSFFDFIKHPEAVVPDLADFL